MCSSSENKEILKEAVELLEEADDRLEWFDYDDEGESYNNEEVIELSRRIRNFLDKTRKLIKG